MIRCPAGGGAHHINTSRHHDFELIWTEMRCCRPDLIQSEIHRMLADPFFFFLLPMTRLLLSVHGHTAVLSYCGFRAPSGKGLPNSFLSLAFWNTSLLQRTTVYTMQWLSSSQVVRATSHTYNVEYSCVLKIGYDNVRSIRIIKKRNQRQ